MLFISRHLDFEILNIHSNVINHSFEGLSALINMFFFFNTINSICTNIVFQQDAKAHLYIRLYFIFNPMWLYIYLVCLHALIQNDVFS